MIIILARVVEEALQRAGLVSHACATIKQIRVRAGRVPCTDLSRVPVSLSIAGQDSGVIAARAQIGGFEVHADLEPAELPAMGGAVVRPYGDGYLKVAVESAVTSWDPASMTLMTHHAVRPVGSFDGTLFGLDAAIWPALTNVGNLLLFGQMAQILVQFAAGIHRGSAENLWVRRIALSRSAVEVRHEFDATARLLHHQVIERGGFRHHNIKLEAQTGQGISASATFGFVDRLPSTDHRTGTLLNSGAIDTSPPPRPIQGAPKWAAAPDASC